MPVDFFVANYLQDIFPRTLPITSISTALRAAAQSRDVTTTSTITSIIHAYRPDSQLSAKAPSVELQPPGDPAGQLNMQGDTARECQCVLISVVVCEDSPHGSLRNAALVRQ